MTDQISDAEVDFVTGHLFNRLGLSRWGLCVEDVSEVAREVVTELATRRAQSAVSVDGWVKVPVEPAARVIAAAFVQTEDPSEDDMRVARQALTLLPSSPVEKVTEALADLSRDYRALVKAAQEGK